MVLGVPDAAALAKLVLPSETGDGAVLFVENVPAELAMDTLN